MLDILVLNEKDIPIGKYQSIICPRVGDIIDATNGSWIVQKVQHDIVGHLIEDAWQFREIPIQKYIIIYCVECK